MYSHARYEYSTNAHLLNRLNRDKLDENKVTVAHRTFNRAGRKVRRASGEKKDVLLTEMPA